jgi:hypothetical protein
LIFLDSRFVLGISGVEETFMPLVFAKGLAFHLYDTRDSPPTTDDESPEPRLIFEFPEFSVPIDIRFCAFLGSVRNRYKLPEHETSGLFCPSHDDDVIYMVMRFSGTFQLSNEYSKQKYLLRILKSTFLNRAASLGSVEPNSRPIHIDSKDWFSSVFISSHSHSFAALVGSRWLYPSKPQENTVTIQDYHTGRANRAKRLPTFESADPNMKISYSHLTYDFDDRWLKNTSDIQSKKPAQRPYFEVTRSLPEGINATDKYLLSDSAVIFIKVRTLIKLQVSIAWLT